MSRSKDALVALRVSAKRNKGSYLFVGARADKLERFKAPQFNNPGQLRFPISNIVIEVPEFTSLCPITGQPDFARLTISYVPDKWCVESKSLKLYLMSYRQTGAFHEQCLVKIADDLSKLLDPASITVAGTFGARGGIAFNPVVAWHRRHQPR